jgi:CBS domain containing-hemolysin-like protein
MFWSLFIIILTIILSAFFSGIETALISCNKVRVRYKLEKGSRSAKSVWSLLQNTHKILITTLVGNNICTVAGSVIATKLCMDIFHEFGPLIATIVMTPLLLVFGEIIPKAVFRAQANTLIFIFGPLLIVFEKIFLPINILIEHVSNIIVRGLGIKKMRKDLFVTKEDIELLVRQIAREGVIERSEQGAIHQIFDFRYTRVVDIMIRLHNVVSIDYSDNREKILEKAKKYKFTRYPVIENKQIKGVLNIFDIFYDMPDMTMETKSEVDWHKYIRPIKQVYANQRINQVLYQMQRNKDLMSAVVRNGKFIGIISLEDIISEIELI